MLTQCDEAREVNMCIVEKMVYASRSRSHALMCDMCDTGSCCSERNVSRMRRMQGLLSVDWDKWSLKEINCVRSSTIYTEAIAATGGC